MPYLNDIVMDSGLYFITNNANRVDINSTVPINYTEATSTYSLGYKTSISVGSPVDGAVDGRQVVVSAISSGSIFNSGIAVYWSLSDTINSLLIAAGPLETSGVVNSGEYFDLTEFGVTIPDPS